MLKEKAELARYLNGKRGDIFFNEEKKQAIINGMHDNYDVPVGKIMDLITGRAVLENESEFLLFLFIYHLDIAYGKHKTSLYYTPQEIEEYSKAKYYVEKFEFPIEIKCVQVTNDQWIGATDVEFLMKLRSAQLINYNANAQRTMQRIVRGEKSFFKIALNTSAVEQIKKSFHNGNFIPNTITLNIPETSDYYYDKDKQILVINSLDHFDISDGYHRYVALCQEKNDNPDFNYPLELRLISFSDTKIKNFIFQEDQKTKMRKVDSQSMDMNAVGNIITERLNEDVLFNLRGKISRTQGAIDFPTMAMAINNFYCQDKDNSMKKVVAVEKEIKEKLNYITEHYNDLLDKGYFSNKEIVSLVYCLTKMTDQYNVSSAEADKVIATINKAKELDTKLYQTSAKLKLKKALINALDQLWAET